MSGGPLMCLNCPTLRRTLCLVPCCEEVNAAIAADHAQLEREERYQPPLAKAREILTVCGDKVRRRWRRGVDDLR